MSQAGIISINSQPGVIDFLQGNSGGPISPNGANIINVVGDGLYVTTTGDNGTHTITISLLASSPIWSRISASQTLLVNHAVICVAPGGALSLALPAASAVGSLIEVALQGATSWSIKQGAGQQIQIGNQLTTSGVTGSLTSTSQGDCIRMVCTSTNLSWMVISSIGNPTVV